MAVRDLATLDPAKATGRGALTVIANVFDSLTAIDPETGRVVPSAASSWRSSRDARTWRFRIARHSYTDGTRVRARDFEAAFDRLTRKSVDSDIAFQLEPVRGFQASRVRGSARSLAGVSASGALLTIRLTRPFAELPYFLAHPSLGPLHPKHQKNPASIARAPIGNGPFKVERVEPTTSAALVPNEHAAGATPYLERVELTVVRSIGEGWEQLEGGDVHVADVPIGSMASAVGRYAEGGFTPQWATLSFAPNLGSRKYRNPSVRRALALAIDRVAIARTVYGETKQPATGIVPTGVRGSTPDGCSACETDLARARRIVRAAFGARPPVIRVDHLNDQASRQVARAVAGDLTEAGFRAQLRAYTRKAYGDLLRRNRHDFAEVGWIADVPTPDGFLAQQLRTNSSNNQSRFSDTRFDRLLDSARRTREERARLRLYRRAEARALSLMPLIPIVFFRNRTAAAEQVRGFHLDGAGVFDATQVWLAD